MTKIFFFFSLLYSITSFAQLSPDSVTVKDSAGLLINPIPDTIVDLRPRNKYGKLLNDDPVFNRRYAWPLPLARVTSANVFNWAVCRYIFKFDWARISTQDWKNNLKYGWEWDVDRFGVNFIGHPHTGSNYFNVARSNGYSFWATYPFTIAGSFMWEYFGENTRPSKNDLITTPVSGAFLGEILYRISSNILDDRKRGTERVWREILAGLINPTRALNRFTQKKMWRVSTTDVYQQEPVNITFSMGAHRVNENNKFGTGATNAIANLQLDYGDPFEIRKRKPFDVFRLKLEGRYGDDKKIVDNVLGHGLLFGKNIIKGNHGMLAGIFQHFDYWNNKIFEVGSLGFGPGIISKIKFGRNSTLYSGLHFAGVPIAGNSTRFGPDTSEFRDYPFGGGWEAKIEERLNLAKWISIGLNGYYYWIFNYEGSKGKSRIGILKPLINLRLFKNTSLGFEHHIYYDNHFINDFGSLHLNRTEQKIFLQFFLQGNQRDDRYH